LRELDLSQKATSSPAVIKLSVTHGYTPTCKPEILIDFREKAIL